METLRIPYKQNGEKQLLQLFFAVLCMYFFYES